MAHNRVFIDGFESGSYDLWDQYKPVIGGEGVVTGGSLMDGTYCFSGFSNGGWLKKTVTDATSYYVAFKFKSTAFGGYGATLCDFLDNTDSKQIFLFISSVGQLILYRGGNVALSYGPNLSINVVYLIEWYGLIDPTVGVSQVKVDSILTSINFSGNTRGGANSNISNFAIEGGNSGYFDDIVIDSANWPGNTKIQAIVPTGAGNSSQWTPSVGNNWDCVNEIPASDTDYVTSNINAQVDDYVYSDLVDNPSSIICVQPQARIIKEGIPAVTNLQFDYYHVATAGDHFSANVSPAPTTNYHSVYYNWNTDPHTGVDWVAADIDANNFGIKSIT